jgi:hypothetical protein
MSETFTPAETIPCSRCDREMQLDALDVVTRLYVYFCECGNERQISRTELEALDCPGGVQ